MKKETKLILGIFIVFAIAMASCSKSSNSASPSTEIQGTWKITKQYLDTNGNGIMDANEQLPTDTSWAHQTILFNSNGSVIITYYNSVIQENWSLIDNNTYLKVVDTSIYGGTLYDDIPSLSSSSMELKDTTGISSGHFIKWTYYAKQ